MTKAELMAAFPSFSPKRAFKRFDEGEEVPYEVAGKWVRIARMTDGAWDVFLCNTRGMAKGMGTRRLVPGARLGSRRHRAPRGRLGSRWQSPDTGLVRGWLEAHRVSLGIPKRVELSELDLQRRFLRMKSMKSGVSGQERTEGMPW